MYIRVWRCVVVCGPRQERVDAWKSIDTLKSPAPKKKTGKYTYRDLYELDSGEAIYGQDDDGNPLGPDGNPVSDWDEDVPADLEDAYDYDHDAAREFNF